MESIYPCPRIAHPDDSAVNPSQPPEDKRNDSGKVVVLLTQDRELESIVRTATRAYGGHAWSLRMHYDEIKQRMRITPRLKTIVGHVTESTDVSLFIMDCAWVPRDLLDSLCINLCFNSRAFKYVFLDPPDGLFDPFGDSFTPVRLAHPTEICDLLKEEITVQLGYPEGFDLDAFLGITDARFDAMNGNSNGGDSDDEDNSDDDERPAKSNRSLVES